MTQDLSTCLSSSISILRKCPESPPALQADPQSTVPTSPHPLEFDLRSPDTGTDDPILVASTSISLQHH